MAEDVNLELIEAHVAPAGRPYERGIVLAEGGTAPFLVGRTWAGPAGYYWEQWSIRRGGKEILFSGALRQIFVKGIQSVRTYTDTVDQPIKLEPGAFNLVFIVEGLFMGAVEIEVSAAASSAA